jgi:transposase-like protein
VVQELHGRAPLPEEGARGPHEPAPVRRGRGPWYSWAFRELGLEHCRGAFGDRSGVERFFGSLKRRTSAFFKDINAGRSRITSLDGVMNMFFVYYNGPRFQ